MKLPVFFKKEKSISINKIFPKIKSNIKINDVSTLNRSKKFDLTLGEESYKKEWSNSKISLYDFVEPNNLRSYPYYIYLMIKLKVKNFKKNL